jgi:hypothetical protein
LEKLLTFTKAVLRLLEVVASPSQRLLELCSFCVDLFEYGDSGHELVELCSQGIVLGIQLKDVVYESLA